jgi:hypothetical protein
MKAKPLVLMLVLAGLLASQGKVIAMNEVQFRATTAKESFAAGESVVLHLAVTNRSRSEVVLWRSSFFVNHRIIVKRLLRRICG